MKAKIAGLVLLFGLSATVHAHSGHHHPTTFEQPQGNTSPKSFEKTPATNNGLGSGKVVPEISKGGGTMSSGGSGGVTAPIPEPETYAMMMAGLGIVVAVARRRKEKQESQGARTA